MCIFLENPKKNKTPLKKLKPQLKNSKKIPKPQPTQQYSKIKILVIRWNFKKNKAKNQKKSETYKGAHIHPYTYKGPPLM